jgi:23S rRNA (pseudouridine1915-N3)-methyltransferase
MMLLHILARGRIGRGPEAELVDRYAGRLNWPFRMTELPDRGGRIPPLAQGGVRVLLDEQGDQMSSMELAKLLGRWRDEGRRECRFEIGAADGFEAPDRAEADKLIAFGRATWPHLMARAMLAEQLWRATSILANHPYHREG